jgi:endonuclease/exonuclease/phosphatase family metal-dependent hydrolase
MHLMYFLVVLSFAATAAPPGSRDLAAGLRILDWNINKGKRLPAVARAIQEFTPDLCLLQEVDANARRTGDVSVVEQLGRQLGYAAHFAPAFREISQDSGDGEAWNGQGLLSRVRIKSVRTLPFRAQTGFWKPRPWIPEWRIMQRRQGGRVAQISELDVHGSTLVVYNLHLESRSGRTRLAQLNETLQDAARYGAGIPVVIAGDLNTQFRIAPYLDALRAAGFRNCFGHDRPRTHRLYGRVDWIFVRGPVTCSEAAVHRDVKASDHYPITAVLKLGSSQAESHPTARIGSASP